METTLAIQSATLAEANARTETALQGKQAADEQRLLGNYRTWIHTDQAHPTAVPLSDADRLSR